nr:olfactory receptor 5W2-like [Pelodiscus sinensis]|eukprot:XP_025033956.1 olfactory receptor 5W2-like [Pelodiscus sinensis]
MAYDRYVAICNPLHYMLTMSRQRCYQLLAGVCAMGLMDALILTCSIFQLSFCGSNIVRHYLCEMPQLLLLSCSDTRISDIVQLASLCCVLISSALTILLSYVFIISTILRIYSVRDIECLLLAVMVYDHYVAICNPLLYTVTMSRQRCIQLVAGALSCSDTQTNEIVSFVSMCYTVVISVMTILLSHVYIISTIVQIRSAEDQCKAFSTCASHLCVVVIFYGALLFMYFRPTSSYSMDTDKMTSVFYPLVIPMLNPLIYSLGNREAKDALRKARNKLLTNSCSGNR